MNLNWQLIIVSKPERSEFNMSSNGGNGGSNIFGMIMIFFVLVFAIYLIVNVGRAFFSFAEKNGEIVMIAFILTLFIAFKIFTNDKPN